jgi:hypothetical protein
LPTFAKTHGDLFPWWSSHPWPVLRFWGPGESRK